jgi:hypothetical protein
MGFIPVTSPACSVAPHAWHTTASSCARRRLSTRCLRGDERGAAGRDGTWWMRLYHGVRETGSMPTGGDRDPLAVRGALN